MKKLILNSFWFFLVILGGFNLTYAQEKFPSKPLSVIGLWTAGGTTDLATRALSEVAQKHFGQPWINEVKPGAGGMIGMAYVAKAKPDGYTIVGHAGAGQIITNFFLQDLDLKQSDFDPVIQWASYDNILAVNAGSPWKTMKDLVEYAKKNPGAVKYATVGKGSSPHFQVEVMCKQVGIKLTPVFYKGNPDAVTSVLDGIIPMISSTYEGSKEHARAGKLRILMTFSPNGIEEAPEIPTFKQALGIEQKLLPSFFAIFVPKGTPEDRKKVIHDSVRKAIEDPQFKETMKRLNTPIFYSDGASLKKRIEEETKIIGGLIRELGMGK